MRAFGAQAASDCVSVPRPTVSTDDIGAAAPVAASTASCQAGVVR